MPVVPRIYCINLDRSPDRWNHMMRQFEALGLAYRRISAVDGRTLTESVLPAVAEMDRVADWPDLLTPSAIGCALSHVEAYRRMLAAGESVAIVMEDDIDLSADFAAIAASAAAALPEDAIALLYFHGDAKRFTRQGSLALRGQHRLYPAVSPWGAYAAGAYIIGAAAAERLAEFNRPVYTTADSWGVYCRERQISGLWAVLPPVTASAPFGSDIGYSTVGRASRRLERILPRPLARRLRRLLGNQGHTDYILSDEQPQQVGSPERVR